MNVFLLACRQPDQVRLEIRQHTALADHDAELLGLAALDRLSVQRTVEIHDYAVAVRRLALYRLPAALLPTQALDGAIDVGIADLGLGLLDAQADRRRQR